MLHFSALCQVSARGRKLCNEMGFLSSAPLLGYCSERMSHFMEDSSQPQLEPLVQLDCISSQTVLGKYTSGSPLPWDVLHELKLRICVAELNNAGIGWN